MYHWEEGMDSTAILNTLLAQLNALYLKLDTSNDPLTGELVIIPAAGTNALRANKDITLKSGQKLIFDGA
jgi:hypothetical protein